MTKVINACEKGQQWSHAIHLFTDTWTYICFILLVKSSLRKKALSGYYPINADANERPLCEMQLGQEFTWLSDLYTGIVLLCKTGH